MKLLALALSSMLLSVSAFACPGAYVQFNPTSWLSAEGIHGSKGLEVSTTDMEAQIKRGGRAAYRLGDSGIMTHRVEFLGSVRDEGGIVQAIYMIKDLKTNKELTAVLKSNYMGNGARARSIGGPDSQLRPVESFETLAKAGCN